MALAKKATGKGKKTTTARKGKITHVTYERLRNLGNYENERVCATVEVVGKAPEKALEQAREFVNIQLGYTVTDSEKKDAAAKLAKAFGISTSSVLELLADEASI